MSNPSEWQQVQDNARQAGYVLLALDDNINKDTWSAHFHEEPPTSVRTFVTLWTQHTASSWEALVASAEVASKEGAKNALPDEILPPLRSLVERTEHCAIIWGHTRHWTSPNQWGYLCDVRSPQSNQRFGQILLHPPATDEDIAEVERVLSVALPPTYKQFLLVTNGLGIGYAENSYICGAGMQRANWDDVLSDDWQRCTYQHEITAEWRAFQGVYAEERQIDRERGEQTFRSDETILIPFAYTYETWCFDRNQRDPEGEARVELWDHELRQAEYAFPDFPTWFANEVDPYLFGS